MVAPIERLPPELLANALSYLSPKELRTAGAACRLLRSASMDDRLWRPWAEYEVQTWSTWELDAALDGETCRDYVIKCLAAEEWIIDRLLPDRRSWQDITVSEVCNKYTVGAFKRFALCYSVGSRYWYGVVMSPQELWIDSPFYERRPVEFVYMTEEETAQMMTERELREAVATVDERYLPAYLRWDSKRCAFAGLDWTASAAAAELYMLCRRVLGAEVLVDAWNSVGKTCEEGHWDMVDMADAVLGFGIAFDDLALSGGFEQELHMLRTAYLTDEQRRNIEQGVASGTMSARDVADMLLHLYHCEFTAYIEPKLGALLMLRVIRGLGEWFDVSWMHDKRVYSLFIVKAVAKRGPAPTAPMFVLDVVQRTARSVVDVAAVYAAYRIPIPRFSPQRGDPDALHAMYGLRQHPATRSPLVSLLVQTETDCEDFGALLADDDGQDEDGISSSSEGIPAMTRTYSPPFSSKRVPFWAAFRDATTASLARSVLEDIRSAPLLSYLQQNNVPVGGLRPHRAPTSTGQYRVGDLVAVGPRAAPHATKVTPDGKEWAVITAYTPGSDPSDGWYECRVAGRTRPRRFRESAQYDRRDQLYPGESPALFGTFLALGRSFHYLYNGRFIPCDWSF